VTTTPEPETAPAPPGLDDAEVYVRADAPDSYGRWYVRADGSVAYQWPSGEWNENPILPAETLRNSPLWTKATP
jgi:hypothetical protein